MSLDNNNINLNNDVSTNSIETKTNLILLLRTQTTNNADYLNSIIFQNTGSYYNIALTRRYGNSMTSNTSNLCIQTGASGAMSGLPIRFCVRTTGEVNIRSSQMKTHGFNVEGTSNFESTITGTNINITGNYQVNGVNLPTTNTEYLLGNNFSFDTSTTPDTIIMNNDLTSINSIKTISTNDLTVGASDSTQAGDKIILKTNDVQRAYINNTELDLSVDVNIPVNAHYKIDGIDVLHDA